jgi:GxxExxY protein
MTENELATIAVDICYKIHTRLGPGLLESFYEAAFAYELDETRYSLYPSAGYGS